MTTLGLVDRLQTIVVTATLTSAAWIVVGTVFLDRTGAPAPAAPSSAAGEEPVAATSAMPVGAAPPAGHLMIPVRGVSPADLSDNFDQDRGGRRHEAIDIMAPAGTPVIAAGAGTIERLFQSDAGGNTIYVRTVDRNALHYYAHLQGYAQGLKEGEAVRPGQPLGTVGSTGNADPAAPHLHFAVLRIAPSASWWESGAAIDPYPLLVAK
jgi:murein DD-endopeptidase MepM/ murein hydrolase activator NlpD